MLPIHDRDGVVVSWLTSDRLYSNTGQPLGFVQDGTVFQVSGRAIGYFKSGIFLDRAGETVGFLRRATIGPAKPVARLAPLAPKVDHFKVPAVSSRGSVTPARSMSWSSRTWQDWVSGQTQTQAPKTRCRVVRRHPMPLAA